MTNGDHIRSMTDEELAEWIDKCCNRERDDWEGMMCYDCICYDSNDSIFKCSENCEWSGGTLEWLKRSKL